MSENLAHFELRPEIGEHPDDPLQSISAPVAVPMMVGREIGEGTEVHIITQRPKLDQGHSARVIPGTRIVEVRDRLLRHVLTVPGRVCTPIRLIPPVEEGQVMWDRVSRLFYIDESFRFTSNPA